MMDCNKIRIMTGLGYYIDVNTIPYDSYHYNGIEEATALLDFIETHLPVKTSALLIGMILDSYGDGCGNKMS